MITYTDIILYGKQQEKISRYYENDSKHVVFKYDTHSYSYPVLDIFITYRGVVIFYRIGIFRRPGFSDIYTVTGVNGTLPFMDVKELRHLTSKIHLIVFNDLYSLEQIIDLSKSCKEGCN